MEVQRQVFSSHIERVMVYARGAHVTRSVDVPSPHLLEAESLINVVVEGISPLAEPSGMRATVTGGCSVLAIRSRLVVPAAAEVASGVVERLDQLRRARVQLETDRSELAMRRDAMGALIPEIGIFPRSARFDASARIADGIEAMGLVDRVASDLDDRIRKIDVTLDENGRLLQAAEMEAAQARSVELSRGAHPTREVVVRLVGPGSLEKLSLTYAVKTARWWPAYTLRLDQRTQEADCTLEAFVAQATFEDWDDVELSLSTADLRREVALPELPSWRLGRAQPSKKRGYRPAPSGLEVMFAGYDRVMAHVGPPPATPVSTTLLAPPEPSPLVASAWDAPQEMVRGLQRQDDLRALDEDEGHVFNAAFEEHEELDTFSAAPAAQYSKGAFEADRMEPVAAYAPSRGAVASSMAPPQAKRRAKREHAAGGEAPGGRAAPGAVLEPLEPEDTWLDFDGLVMADMSSRQRGRLVRREAPTGLAAQHDAERELGEMIPLHSVTDPAASRGDFDHVYRASARVEVPSNGQVHRLGVQSARTVTRAICRAIPLEVPEIYREVALTNPLAAPLLAGPVDVFIGSGLVTTTAISAVDIGGEVIVGLGVEERVRVARNVRVEESTSGLFGGSTDIEHCVTIEVSSALGHDVQLLVVDRVPITHDPEVKIKVVDTSPAYRKYDQSERGEPVEGAVQWKLELAAGGKQTITFVYVIQIPSKREIVGGNRRD